jgi:type III secretion protein T
MDVLAVIEPWAGLAARAGLCSLRPAVACLLLPILAPDVVPAMVRNGLFLTMGALALTLQPAVLQHGASGLAWLTLAAQEALVGLGLGFGLASLLWAFAAAGDIVDAKVGLNALRILDASSGTSNGPSGALLGRLAAWAFMACGGLGAFMRVVVDSFRIWPAGLGPWQPWPTDVALFEWWFADGSARALLVAAPVLVVLFAVDLVLGLINRFAPQIPLIALSASLKAWAAVAVWLLMLATLLHGFDGAVLERIHSLLPALAKGQAVPG